MGIDKSPNHLRGFILPLRLSSSDIWEAEATYTTAEKEAGAALASGKEKLVINTSGKQTNTIDLKTQKAGTPGKNAAGFVWKRDTESQYYGDNSFNAITDFQFLKIKSTLPIASYSDPSCLALQNGDLLLAYESTEAGGLNGIVVKRMASDGSVFSSGTLVFNATTYVSSLTASKPAMVQLADGSVLLIVWANYVVSTNLSNLYVYRSTDNGINWNLVSTGALDASIDRSVYTLGQIHVAQYNGQILLISGIKKTGATRPDVLFQAASVDDGMSFTTIGTTDNNYYCFSPSLLSCDDGFLLTYITNTDDAATSDGVGQSFIFPNAFFPFANRGSLVNAIGSYVVGTVSTSAPKEFTAGESTSWRDEENNIFVIFRNLTTDANSYGGNGGLWMMVSADNGSTWNYAGGNTPTYITPYIQSMNDDTEKLQNYRGCSTKGKSWIFCQPKTSSGTLDNSLLLFCLRGYSSVTLPNRFQDATIYQQFGYNHVYLPFILPDILPEWVDIVSGVPTTSITTAGLKLDTGTTSSISYKYNFLTPDANHTTTGILVRFVVRAAAGGVTTAEDIACKIYIGDTTHSYKIVYRFSGTQFVLRDDLGGSDLVTITPNPSSILTDTGVEILVALGNGKVSSWWRSNDHIDAKGWNEITSNSTVADGGSSATNYVQIGNLVAPSSGTVTSYWGEVCISYKKGLGGQYYPPMYDGFSNPGDLSAKLYPSYGNSVNVAEGMFISTQDGPAQLTDSYTIDPSSSYGIENIFHSQSPSPQSGWRGEAITSPGAVPSEFIPLQLDSNGENIQFMSDLLGIHLGNINFKDFTIEGYDAGTSSWQVLATINTGMSIKSYRYGNRLDADPTGASPYRYFFHDELAGSIVQMPSAPHPVYREVITNSEGSWKGGTQPRPATILLKETDSSDPSNPDAVLIPKNVTIVLNLNGSRYSSIGIRISSQNTITNDFRIGHLSIGPVHIVAPQYSHGREIGFTANTETYEQPDGIVRTRNRGKGKRNFSISWTEPVDTSAFMPLDGTPAPDYYKSSNNASAQAVASYGGVPFNILGYIRQMQGPDRPVIYLPSIKYATNAAEEIRVYNRELQHALVMLDDNASIDNAIGEELVAISGEAFRISTINLVEVI